MGDGGTAKALVVWQNAVAAYEARARTVTAGEHPYVADELEALDWEQHRTLEAYLALLRGDAPPGRRGFGRHRRQ
jgi:hypothetical protein